MEKGTTKKHKFLALFSVLRGYNILLLAIAQYLAAIFVFTVDQTLKELFFDWHLHLVVLSSVSVVSAGYIINDFYDISIDAINRPVKTQIGNWLSQTTRLKVYFTLNALAVFLSMSISWRAALFFSGYIFLIWFYSHKLQKYPLVRIISITVLSVFPFFAVFVYYENVSELIIIHGFYLSLLILIKELIKDFKRAKGAVLTNTDTMVSKYGEYRIKIYLYILLVLVVIPTCFLLQFPEIGQMRYYFYASIIWIPLFFYLLVQSKTSQTLFSAPQFIKIYIGHRGV